MRDTEALSLVIVRLLEVYAPPGVSIWLRAPNPGLDGRRPLDVLNTDPHAVLSAVDRLRSGAT